MITDLKGSRHYPPASSLIQVLPWNTTVSLSPEPSNRFDPNAVQVLLARESIPTRTLQNLQPHVMLQLSQVGEVIMLGHLDAQSAALLKGCVPDHATLRFSSTGKPQIHLTWESAS